MVHRLAVELAQGGEGPSTLGEVDQPPTLVAEDRRVVGDTLETAGDGPRSEDPRTARPVPETDRREPLDVPRLPVDLVVAPLPGPIGSERQKRPARDRRAVELEHETAHSPKPLVERQRALVREVA